MREIYAKIVKEQEQIYKSIISTQDITNLLNTIIDAEKNNRRINEKKIKIKLKEEIINLIKERKYNLSPEIACKFIDNNVIISNDVEKNIKQLNIINNFLTEIEYDYNIDSFIKVIQGSDKLFYLLASICNSIDDVVTINDNLLIFIDAYFTINNPITSINSDNNEFDSTGSMKYIRDINMPILTPEEEKKLALQIKAGNNQARKTFIERNLKLVVSIAKRFQNRGLDMDDLIQEGNIGLIKAVEKFDVTKGFKFSSYATWWIKQAIEQALTTKSRNIRTSIYAYNQMIKINKSIDILQKQLNREPTINEISEFLNIPLDRMIELYSLKDDTVSYNQPINEDAELGEFIEDNDEVFEDDIIDKMRASAINKIINDSSLTEREKKIVELYFGLNGEEPMNLAEIGKLYGLTRERIRIIMNNRILKILRETKNQELIEWTDNPDKYKTKKYKK